MAFPEILDFEILDTDKDGWIRIKLSDGTLLKVKVEITGFVRHPTHDPTGYPVYGINVHPVVRIVSVPKDLRKPVEPPKGPMVS